MKLTRSDMGQLSASRNVLIRRDEVRASFDAPTLTCWHKVLKLFRDSTMRCCMGIQANNDIEHQRADTAFQVQHLEAQ